jgi:hypothetical protein
MSSQHTPGPWRLNLHFLDTDLYREIAAGREYFNPQNPQALTGFSLTGYMSAADARLIAAAPDLLAALRECEARLRAGVERSIFYRGDKELLQKISAAIAKAEVRS